MMRRVAWLLLPLAAAIAVYSQRTTVFPLLSSDVLLGKQPSDFWIVATNQLLRPWGQQSLMPGRPVEAVFDSKKRLLAVLNSRAIHLLDGSTGTDVARITTRSTSLTGLAFRPGDREIWASEATRTGPDGIFIAPLSEAGVPGEPSRIALPGHPVPMGIAFDKEGTTAYVAMSDTGTVAAIDTASRKIIREIPVGSVPYAIAVSSNRRQLYVANRGGRRAGSADITAQSAATAVVTDASTGATNSGTVSVVDLKSLSVRDVVVGLAPAAAVLSPDENTLAVVNAHSDSVTFIDLATLRTSEVRIPAYPEGVFGSTPAAAAFSHDGERLYVACGGTNAIAVLDKKKIVGAVPAGWFPSSVAVDREGNLRVVNVKGVGVTPVVKGGHNSRDFEGSILRIPAPGAAQLQAGLREVIAANAPKFTPTGGVSDLSKLGIEHVFLIIKENRTYDQVFGDMPKGNGDPKLVMYGREITPNHHALAEQFVLLDNFYTGGAISFDGHQWLMQGFVSDYVERAFAASPRGYAWNLADALVVSPAGFFWQDGRRNIDVRLYGPFSIPVAWDPRTQLAHDINESKLAPWPEYWRMYKDGSWRGVVGHRSGVPALQKLINPKFPPSTMNIPDQMRADAWLEELAEREKSGKMPNLLIFTMTSDHTMGTRPGFPTPRAMVADNDLALGRIVEGIAKSRFWPKSLILVTEDDAQDGVDHVDGRRTIALVIGPNVRRGVLDSNHYNHSSMIRTAQDVFRIKPRVRYAASARAMTSVFTTTRDLTPYKAIVPTVSLTEMNPPLKALRGRQLWAAQHSMRINSREVDDFPAHVMNRILWWDAKGYGGEVPARR